MAVAFPLALVSLSWRSWNFAGRCDGGNQGQKAEDVGKGETLKSHDKEGGEDTGECDDDGKVRRSKE